MCDVKSNDLQPCFRVFLNNNPSVSNDFVSVFGPSLTPEVGEPLQLSTVVSGTVSIPVPHWSLHCCGQRCVVIVGFFKPLLNGGT